MISHQYLVSRLSVWPVPSMIFLHCWRIAQRSATPRTNIEVSDENVHLKCQLLPFSIYVEKISSMSSSSSWTVLEYQRIYWSWHLAKYIDPASPNVLIISHRESFFGYPEASAKIPTLLCRVGGQPQYILSTSVVVHIVMPFSCSSWKFRHACVLPFLSAWSIEARMLYSLVGGVCTPVPYLGLRSLLSLAFPMSRYCFITFPSIQKHISNSCLRRGKIYSSRARVSISITNSYWSFSHSGFKYMLLSLTKLNTYEVSTSMPNECSCIVKLYHGMEDYANVPQWHIQARKHGVWRRREKTWIVAADHGPCVFFPYQRRCRSYLIYESRKIVRDIDLLRRSSWHMNYLLLLKLQRIIYTAVASYARFVYKLRYYSLLTAYLPLLENGKPRRRNE